MLDALKNYLNLASGLTEVTRQRAVAAAKALQASGEATAEQVQNLADELVVNSRNNRDALLALVRYEVDRALNRLGLATADEVASLQRRVTSLEGALATVPGEATKAPAKSTAAKSVGSTGTKAAPAKATAAKSTVAAATAAKATAAKSTAARSTAAKSTATKSTGSARKAAPAKKAAGSGSTGA